ncbi:putative ribonuclease H-like domain-containing protein [Tanacetum coccineum]
MDIKSVFLYGTIEEEVYVHQPPGFVDPTHPNKVYKAIKALYGLHQAPRAWYETLSSFLMENGFRRGTIDKTLFIKNKKSDIVLVQVYVDDIIFGSTKKSMCIELVREAGTNEIRLRGSNQGENQPSKFCYATQNAGRREAFDIVSMGYGGQLWILLQSAHGVSASQLWKEQRLMLKQLLQLKVGARREASGNVLIGHGYTHDIPSVAPTVGICSSPFQHSYVCGGKFVSQGVSQLSDVVCGIAAHVQISNSDYGKRKVKRSDGCNIFEACSQLCARNVGVQRSSILTQTTVIGSSPAYDDLGDCNQQCRHCGAAFWYGECLKGHSHWQRPDCHL